MLLYAAQLAGVESFSSYKEFWGLYIWRSYTSDPLPVYKLVASALHWKRDYEQSNRSRMPNNMRFAVPIINV